MLDKIKLHWRQIICAALIILALYWYCDYQASRLQRAQQLTAEQTGNAAALEDALKISRANADQLAAEIKRAQTNKVQPVTYVTVQAPTVEQAAADVTDRINRKDPTLPAAATEPSDRTTVAPQPDNPDYQVGVYKINLAKRHQIKAGVTVTDGDAYASVGYQQDRVEALAHFKDRKLQGGSVMWTVVEW